MHTYSKAMVRRISTYLKEISDGAIGVGQIANPGDGLQYADACEMRTISGRNATKRAIAYYGTAAREYALRTGHNVPTWLDAVMEGLVPTRGAVYEEARAGFTRAAAVAGEPVHLTHDDTWGMILDGGEFRGYWTERDREEFEVLKRPRSGEVFDWTLIVHLDDAGRTATVTHPDIIKAMRVMVAERDQRTTKDSIIDMIAAVLDATSNDAATDELCQLDGTHFDLIAQVAAVGKVVSP